MGFRKILVLGGARSGKSTFAERLAVECGEPVLYVATAAATDDDMAERIARHRARRPSTWRTLEAPTDLPGRLASADAGAAATVLVEDLTLLLSNLLLSEADGAQARAMADNAETRALADGAERRAIGQVEAILALEAHVIVVSNEVGMGVVPASPLGRRFRDALGRVNQAAAAACGEAYLLVAGLPLRLK